MIYAVNPATGRIVARLGQMSPEAQRYVDEDGCVLVDTAGVYDRQAHRFVETEVTITPDEGEPYTVMRWLPEARPAEDVLAEAKASALTQLRANLKRFVSTKPDGQPRYDHDLMLGLLSTVVQYALAGQPTPAPLAAAQSWLIAMQQNIYLDLKGAITAAATLAALAEVPLSYEDLEASYGVSGDVLPDPDVGTADLVVEE